VPSNARVLFFCFCGKRLVHDALVTTVHVLLVFLEWYSTPAPLQRQSQNRRLQRRNLAGRRHSLRSWTAPSPASCIAAVKANEGFFQDGALVPELKLLLAVARPGRGAPRGGTGRAWLPVLRKLLWQLGLLQSTP
jgi:hypothetical protein